MRPTDVIHLNPKIPGDYGMRWWGPLHAPHQRILWGTLGMENAEILHSIKNLNIE
jgi:hypothetical protein